MIKNQPQNLNQVLNKLQSQNLNQTPAPKSPQKFSFKISAIIRACQHCPSKTIAFPPNKVSHGQAETMIGSDEKEWKAQESCFCIASDLQKYHCFCATVRLFGDLGGFGEGIGMVWKSGFSSQPSLGVNLIT